MKTCIVINDVNEKITNLCRKEVSGFDDQIDEIISKYCILSSGYTEFNATSDGGMDSNFNYYEDYYLINPLNLVICNNSIIGHIAFNSSGIIVTDIKDSATVYFKDILVDHITCTDVNQISIEEICDRSKCPTDITKMDLPYDLDKTEPVVLKAE